MNKIYHQNRESRHTGILVLRAISWLVLIVCVIGMSCLLIQQHRAKELSRNLSRLYHGESEVDAGESDVNASDGGTVSFHGGELGLPTRKLAWNHALAEVSNSQGIEAALGNNERAYTSDGMIVVPIGTMPITTDMPAELTINDQFTDLYALNPDIVGWISLCEGIDEPVLLRDNSYYMNHDFDGNHSVSGSIFLDEENTATLSDQMTLIYGHNMKSGAMFGDLDRLREESYLDAHPIIRLHSVYEPEPRNYVICSLFDASMAGGDPSYIHIRQFNFDTPELFQAQLDDIMSRSIIDIPIDVTTDDRYIMLVTCSYSNTDGRFMVVARELRSDESVESIMQYFG